MVGSSREIRIGHMVGSVVVRADGRLLQGDKKQGAESGGICKKFSQNFSRKIIRGQLGGTLVCEGINP